MTATTENWCSADWKGNDAKTTLGMISLLIIGEIWHWYVLFDDQRDVLGVRIYLNNKQPTCDQTNLLNGLKVGTRIDIKLPKITPGLLIKHWSKPRRLDSRKTSLAISGISKALIINHWSLGCFVRWLRVVRKEIKMKIECSCESVNWPPQINHFKMPKK